MEKETSKENLAGNLILQANVRIDVYKNGVKFTHSGPLPNEIREKLSDVINEVLLEWNEKCKKIYDESQANLN